MIEFLKEEQNYGYTQKHIDKCSEILKKYEDDLLAIKKAENSIIMKKIKEVVLALNKLNEKVDYSLIETDQREDLCEFIKEKAISAGLTNTDNDITEEWREW